MPFQFQSLLFSFSSRIDHWKKLSRQIIACTRHGRTCIADSAGIRPIHRGHGPSSPLITVGALNSSCSLAQCRMRRAVHFSRQQQYTPVRLPIVPRAQPRPFNASRRRGTPPQGQEETDRVCAPTTCRLNWPPALTCFPCRVKDKAVLETAYNSNPKPDKAARLDIVKRVSLNEKEVQVSPTLRHACVPGIRGQLALTATRRSGSRTGVRTIGGNRALFRPRN